MSHRILKGSSSPLRDKNVSSSLYQTIYLFLTPLYKNDGPHDDVIVTSVVIRNDVMQFLIVHYFFGQNFTICKNKSSSSGAFRFKPVPIMVYSKKIRSKFSVHIFGPNIWTVFYGPIMVFKSQCSVCHIHFMSEHQQVALFHTQYDSSS